MPTADLASNVALSERLHKLADAFVNESLKWEARNAKEECSRVARTLAEIARHVIRGTARTDMAEAYADAADLILRNVQGARLFFTTLLTTPEARDVA